MSVCVCECECVCRILLTEVLQLQKIYKLSVRVYLVKSLISC